MDPVLLANLAATFAMVGVVWFVQVCHYRLFDRAGCEGFACYAGDNLRLTSWVVLPVMTVEAATALWLALSPPPGVAAAWAWAGVALVAVAWASSGLLQVPLHRRFAASGFDAAAYRRLLATNLVRVAAWTARGALTAGMALAPRG